MESGQQIIRGKHIEIDCSTRRYRAQHGFGPFASHVTGEVSDNSRIVLRTRVSVNFIGDPVRRGACWFEQGEKRWLLDQGELDRVTSRAHEVAGKLRLPVENLYGAQTRIRPTTRIVTWGTWLAMMSILITMLWPALSGSRPIRFIDWNQSWNYNVNQHPAERAFRDGFSAYYRGDFQESERLLREAAKDRSQHAEALNMLAYAQVGQGRMDDALSTAKQAFAAAPTNGNIADTVAEMYQRRGDFAKAANWYEQALGMQPPGEVVETQTKYGETLMALGRRDDALKYLSRAMKMGRTQWSVRAKDVLAGKVTDFRKP